MAPYDAIAKRNADGERLTFARNLLDACDDIVAFVDKRLGWDGTATYAGIMGGSFNISLKVRRGSSDESIIIRFPSPGKVYGPWREEKVRNEVAVMNFIRERTSIPVPRVHCWGVARESPQELGPFIIMDFVEGENLGRFLATPTDDKSKLVFLDPDIDGGKLDKIYEQIAGFMLQLSRLKFPRIGAISKDVTSCGFVVNQRPLTYDMNEVVTVGDFPAEVFASMGPFDRASDYFDTCARYFQTHLETQRNMAGDDEHLAWKQFVARRAFAELVPTYGNVDDNGPFCLYCDDLRPTNMLIDPETLCITAVFDLEFTNVMPAQFAYDVPWWLLLQPPAVWLRDDKMTEFLRLFEPRKDQFIRAMQRVEARWLLAGEPHLSDQMLASWNTRRFWFNLASRCSFDVDDFYWQALHEEGLDEVTLDPAQWDQFVKQKKRQFEEYCREKERRFAKE